MLKRYLAVLVLFIFITSCQSTNLSHSSAAPFDKDAASVKKLKNNIEQNSELYDRKYGYIFFAVEGDVLVESIKVAGKKRFTFEPVKNLNGISFILAKAPKGNYYFSRVKTGYRDYKVPGKYDWRFKVEPGKVNYAGHIEIKDFNYNGGNLYHFLELANKSSFAIEHILERSDIDLSLYPLAYQGPGEDNFIEFFQSKYLSGGQE